MMILCVALEWLFLVFLLELDCQSFFLLLSSPNYVYLYKLITPFICHPVLVVFVGDFFSPVYFLEEFI